jgi:putative acetyltransferase
VQGDGAIEIKVDDLSGDEITNLLNEHIKDMQSVSPPESSHALDLEGLRQSDITFWSVWDNRSLAGCGAIKELDPNHAEIKSMRTSSSHARKGIASKLLQHIIAVAEQRGYRRLSLETGSMAYFEAARNLYQKFGFEYCSPFSDYKEDPNSLFMSKEL